MVELKKIDFKFGSNFKKLTFEVRLQYNIDELLTEIYRLEIKEVETILGFELISSYTMNNLDHEKKLKVTKTEMYDHCKLVHLEFKNKSNVTFKIVFKCFDKEFIFSE